HLDLRSFPTRRSSDLAANTGYLNSRSQGCVDKAEVEVVDNVVAVALENGIFDLLDENKQVASNSAAGGFVPFSGHRQLHSVGNTDRKSTRLNSSHVKI